MTRYPLLYAILIALFCSLLFGQTAQAENITVRTDGGVRTLTARQSAGIDLLPLGGACSALGIDCRIDPLLAAATVGSTTTGARFLAGERYFLRDGSVAFLPAAGEFADGDLYLPAAAVAEELTRVSGRTITFSNRTLAQAPAARVVAPAPPPVLPAPVPGTSRFELRRIVIDAGHGGTDPGAVGNGLRESEINLAIALRTAEHLRQRLPGVQLVFPRQDDRFISLGGRTKLANDEHADLFISIHCNASVNSSASGFEIFVLAAEASDNSARATAALENAAIEYESAESRRQYQSGVGGILASLQLTEYQQESVELAGLIKKQVVPRLGVADRGVKSANFYVLRGALMPAVLVETAFITNAADAARLANPEYQDLVAGGIADGVVAFRNQYALACSR